MYTGTPSATLENQVKTTHFQRRLPSTPRFQRAGSKRLPLI